MRCRSLAAHVFVALWLVWHPVASAAAAEAAAAGIPATSELGQDADANPPPELRQEQRQGRSFLTDFEHWLTLVILGFGALVLLAEYLLLRDARKSPYELMQLFAVNLIITGTLVLISAGYSAEQIAPALGLFGTIAGYLLGRRPSERGSSSRDSSDESGAKKGDLR